MRYRLGENLFCCTVGHRVVFLDLARDRYFRLPPHREKVFNRFLATGRVAEGELEPLMEDGIFASAAVPPAELPDFPPPRDLLLAESLPLRKRDVARSLAARISARHRLRRKGLSPFIEEIRGGTPGATETTPRLEARLRALTAAFAASRAFLRSQDRCLPDSLAMMALCRREGLPARLIFGVRLDPFTAHCWVQSRDVVITGEVDDARMCAPILVLP